MSENNNNDNNELFDDIVTDDPGQTIRQTFVLGEVKGQTPMPDEVPLIPLRDAVLYPGTVVPIMVERAQNKQLIAEALKNRQAVLTSPMPDPKVDQPTEADLCPICVVAQIIKVMTMPDDTITVILRGAERVQLGQIVKTDPYIIATYSRLPEEILSAEQEEKVANMLSAAKSSAAKYFNLMDSTQVEVQTAIRNIDDLEFLCNFVASNLEADIADKIRILSGANVLERAQALLETLERGVQFLQLRNDIQSKARQDIDKQQREYMLQQQMRTIQNELGDNPQEQRIRQYREQAAKKSWSKEVNDRFWKEVDKFSRLRPESPEFSMLQDYLDTLIELPWNKCTKDRMDLDAAAKQLDKDHFGLEKVKERILEHLAVLKLKGDLKSPILCLYGPPGVGKTSLGKSIATALGRKYARVSLGGLHDEAEIRGHRRTYIGAMPGRIIEGIKNAGTSNPVFILDEIDKISHDFHGDPASALLEVLDPEQNVAFHDNYIDLDYDLSKVLFIATANNISQISGPLLDRMELIPVDGYLLEEKVEIAKAHLIPKEIKAHGLKAKDFDIEPEAVKYLIEKYTRESGVRELNKTIATLCRKQALAVARKQKPQSMLGQAQIRQMLGAEKFDHDIWHSDLRAGVVTGLAWTAVGGEILFVECAASKGKGKMTLTGNLGDVMKESAVLALEYVRSNAQLFGLQDVDFDQENFHIHVPEGAVPKDGPSAGITMVTAIVSALTGRRVKKRVAMTGEITLRGMVIPVGGITEKILAAKRAGITDIILCEQNKKDIDEIKKEYVDGLTFHFVKQIAEVIEQALETEPTGIPASYYSLAEKNNEVDQ